MPLPAVPSSGFVPNLAGESGQGAEQFEQVVASVHEQPPLFDFLQNGPQALMEAPVLFDLPGHRLCSYLRSFGCPPALSLDSPHQSLVINIRLRAVRLSHCTLSSNARVETSRQFLNRFAECIGVRKSSSPHGCFDSPIHQ